MERALNLSLLAGALAGRTGLPSPEELQKLLTDAEIGLVLRQTNVDAALIETAWYLHAIASTNQARELYSAERQRQAFLVSAHIFDLALIDDGLRAEERLSFGVAAAVGYRRGGREPNATAIMNRLRADILPDTAVDEHAQTLSLEIGLAFLGLESRTLLRWLSSWRRQLGAIAAQAELPSLAGTVLGPTHLLALGAEDLLVGLVRGDGERRERSLARLLSVVEDQAGPEDLNAKWVAAHLLGFAGEALAGSLWSPSVLPPEVPSIVRQAFTSGSPAVVTLWEPQRELLAGSPSPFDAGVRRMVLAVPTSGGKTLVAQLLAVEYLARTDRSICYVVPTRGLGREVRSAMAQRVRILQKEAGDEAPDYFFWDLALPSEAPNPPADVEVMTPERLAHLLRHDAQSVIDRFGMFIFDEAQLLKEQGRGFTLESIIATLELLTEGTDHRIVLISAAMGNAGAIAQWLDASGEALLHQSDWRGPRRLHAVFNTQADWNSTTVEGGAGSKWRYRHTTELRGIIRIRTSDGNTVALSTQGDTGWRLVRKSQEIPPNGFIRDSSSTKQYTIAGDMVRELGHAGSVLVVASTRSQAVDLAVAMASSSEEEHPRLATLIDFVKQQLGPDHPLVETLQHGVGFHHAGLPSEVLEALEEAVKSDFLPYLTCTSTLTDGVNLPVRTVVIFDLGYPGQPEDSRLRGARLVNAIGRAGRAGRETEGWIVLVRAASPADQDFADLDPSADELAVTSSLLTPEVLEAAAQLELATRSNYDAVFNATSAPADFVSFVWQMLAVEEARASDVSALSMERIVDATLMSHQSQQARSTFLALANATKQSYLRTELSARLRWPRPGTSISSARALDQLAVAVAGLMGPARSEGISDPTAAITILEPALAVLLGLPEAPPWIFRSTVRGDSIAVDPASSLRSWIAGASLPDLAGAFLNAVTAPSWRIEQMVAAVSQHFEHYLSWTVGALVDLVNWHLESGGWEGRLCPELGGFIRYGVSDSRALQLMTSGFRSRRLANSVAALAPDDALSVDDMRSWLALMSIEGWRATFGATPSELLDLIDFTRTRRRSLVRSLLEDRAVSVSVEVLALSAFEEGELTLRPIDNEPTPAGLGVYLDQILVATVSTGDHADTQSILDTGFGIDLVMDTEHRSYLRILLSADDE